MTSSTTAGWQGKAALVALYALLAFGPVVGCLAAFDWRVRQLADREVWDEAGELVARIEGVLDGTIRNLRELAELQVMECRDVHMARLRRFVFASVIMKEAAVLDRDGSVMCNSLGEDVANVWLSTPVRTAEPEVTLVTVAVSSSRGRAMRVMLEVPSDRILSAVIGAQHLLPRRLIQGGEQKIGFLVAFTNGAAIAAVARRSDADPVHAMARVASSRYPVVVTAEGGLAHVQDRFMVGRAFVGGVSLVFGLLAVGFFHMTLLRRQREDPTLEMRRALAAGEFIAYYQPLIDIETGTLLGCEVLARWRKPDGTMIPPSAFIDVAERSGFIFPLTLHLMRRAVADLGPVYATRPELECAFNLCAAHFKDESIVKAVRNIFAGAPLSLDQVVLEVTERDPLPDLAVARLIISRFQEMGARVALDDVGTGHGGMSYLLKLGVDIMKIDKLFIDALGSDRFSTAIVDSLLDLAAQLRLDVIAEGVETFAQVEALRRRGVRAAQGYVFSPPLPASSYVPLVEAMARPTERPKAAAAA